MYKVPNIIKRSLNVNNSLEGESLEKSIARSVSNKNPLDKNKAAPLIYTERKQGVLAGTNIRTDRFEVACDAADKIAKSYKARREEKPVTQVKDSEAEPIQGKDVKPSTENTK